MRDKNIIKINQNYFIHYHLHIADRGLTGCEEQRWLPAGKQQSVLLS